VAIDAFGNALASSVAEAMKPQAQSMYSLNTGASGNGAHVDAGIGMRYAGQRATGVVGETGQESQISGALVPEEGWVLAAGPDQSHSLGGYGPASQIPILPFARASVQLLEDRAMNTADPDDSGALLGATAGVAASLGKIALGAAHVGSNLILQSGDILTGGWNHDQPMMRQVWAEQHALGMRVIDWLENPIATATDWIEGVVDRYEAAMAQPSDFDRSYQLGGLFNDVGQGGIGTGLLLRGVGRIGALGMEYVGENAFTGLVTGGSAAQIGAINLRGLDAASRARILERFRSGNVFETQAREAMDVSKNFGRVYGSRELLGKYAVPDSMRTGIVEFKDVRQLSKDLQFQLYEQSGRRIELVVSPKTEYISGPLIETVRASGGALSIFNPRTSLFHPYDFESSMFLIKGSK